MKSATTILLTAAAILSAAAAGDLSFTEKASDVGLLGGHTTENGFGMQYMSPGSAVGDFDRDGDQDLFIVGGTLGIDQLYINNGSGNFTEDAAARGVATAGYRHTGAAVGDYDNDGDLDLFVTCIGTGDNPDPVPNKLFRNDGNGVFSDAAGSAGVKFSPKGLNDSFGSAFGDVDHDGDLDLFVAGWYGGNVLYLNDGDGTFTVQPDSIFNGEVMDLIRGFAPRIIDINDDGLNDILLAADFYTSKVFINNGDGTFTNETVAWGAGLDSNGMGHAQGDFNNDGLIDWYVTSRLSPGGGPYPGSGNMLYMNNGNGSFTESSVAAGVNDGEWGWGADAVDFDHDGLLDIAATNGWNGPYFEIDPTHLWLNNGDTTFTDVAAAAGIAHTGQGRGLLTFDADNDGDRDLLISGNAEPITYYENELAGPDTNAITLFFDTSANSSLAPDGFGTRVEITAGGATQLRILDGGSNYLAQSELSVHVGLGAATSADEIVIRWANGVRTQLFDLPAGRHTIDAPLSCNPADLDGNGINDLADITLFLQAFLSQEFAADLAQPYYIWDLNDIGTFVNRFTTGCP